MRQMFGRNRAFALLSIFLASLSFQAQSAPAFPHSTEHFSYDASREITLSGIVSAVLVKPSSGMIPGSHLLLTTGSGTVDVSLGTFGLQCEGALSVAAAGQQVLVTGVMNTLKTQQVLIARTVKVGDQVYLMRNKHGIPLSPLGRQRSLANAAHNNGENL
jgi:hypothetical protein